MEFKSSHFDSAQCKFKVVCVGWGIVVLGAGFWVVFRNLKDSETVKLGKAW